MSGEFDLKPPRSLQTYFPFSRSKAQVSTFSSLPHTMTRERVQLEVLRTRGKEEKEREGNGELDIVVLCSLPFPPLPLAFGEVPKCRVEKELVFLPVLRLLAPASDPLACSSLRPLPCSSPSFSLPELTICSLPLFLLPLARTSCHSSCRSSPTAFHTLSPWLPPLKCNLALPGLNPRREQSRPRQQQLLLPPRMTRTTSRTLPSRTRPSLETTQTRLSPLGQERRTETEGLPSTTLSTRPSPSGIRRSTCSAFTMRRRLKEESFPSSLRGGGSSSGGREETPSRRPL